MPPSRRPSAAHRRDIRARLREHVEHAEGDLPRRLVGDYRRQPRVVEGEHAHRDRRVADRAARGAVLRVVGEPTRQRHLRRRGHRRDAVRGRHEQVEAGVVVDVRARTTGCLSSCIGMISGELALELARGVAEVDDLGFLRDADNVADPVAIDIGHGSPTWRDRNAASSAARGTHRSVRWARLIGAAHIARQHVALVGAETLPGRARQDALYAQFGSHRSPRRARPRRCRMCLPARRGASSTPRAPPRATHGSPEAPLRRATSGSSASGRATAAFFLTRCSCTCWSESGTTSIDCGRKPSALTTSTSFCEPCSSWMCEPVPRQACPDE